ncbi:elongation factor G [Georgenia thermotolerans]|uniref:Elongation factor G n=1 Tax=Georgenia thermotolerans TaxID=527326 RepID=A0A7J5UQG1_9MICO|nr:elongation factor G [Georgenia thermotolerans]KAE8764451.1 elongation factor G [Georgenia thermotolerans]
MGNVATTAVRNVVLLGHAGSGKTSLAEVLLHRAGATSRLGRVDEGTSVLDVDPESIKRRTTLTLAVAALDWTSPGGERFKVNLLDTPGHDDFGQVVDAALSVADLAVVVVSAVDGVQAGTERAWARCEELGLPRLLFVSKEDKAGADFEGTLAQLRDAFGAAVLPLELPVGSQQSFHGVTDVLFDRAREYDGEGRGTDVDVPADQLDEERRRHDELVEEVVSGDDEQLERYLAGEAISAEDVERTLATEVAAAMVFPVLLGSAASGVGVDRLADFVCELGPSPAQRPAHVLVDGADTEVPADPAGEPLVQVFRTVADQFVGQVSLLKVLSGTLQGDEHLTNTSTGTDERLHGLFFLRGKEHLPAEEVVAGDLAGVAKLSGSPTRSLLALPGRPVALAALPAPAAGFTRAVRPVTQSDDDKLPEALRKLCAEDPGLVVVQDEEAGQVLVTAVGDTHLAVALERLERKFGVRVETEDVRVPYRETIARPVEVEGKVKKQSGGHGQFAVVQLKVSPAPRGAGLEFVDSIVGGAIPRHYLPAVERGIEDAMAQGGPLGHRVTDLVVECVDGKYHSVDSSDMAFRTAAALGLSQALAQAGTVALEPVWSVSVTVPSGSQGDVLADLATRRGRVVDTGGGINGDEVIEALVPMAELRRYAVDLRAITAGRGRYRAVPDRYEPVPENLAAATKAGAAR